MLTHPSSTSTLLVRQPDRLCQSLRSVSLSWVGRCVCGCEWTFFFFWEEKHCMCISLIKYLFVIVVVVFLFFVLVDHLDDECGLTLPRHLHTSRLRPGVVGSTANLVRASCLYLRPAAVTLAMSICEERPWSYPLSPWRGCVWRSYAQGVSRPCGERVQPAEGGGRGSTARRQTSSPSVRLFSDRFLCDVWNHVAVDTIQHWVDLWVQIPTFRPLSSYTRRKHTPVL